MSVLRTAFILFLAGGTASAFADEIACESHHERVEACTTIMPGSRVRLVEQLGTTPCIEGRNWSLDTNLNSLWVSRGCSAVFDVQPPRDPQYRSHRLGEDEQLR